MTGLAELEIEARFSPFEDLSDQELELAINHLMQIQASRRGTADQQPVEHHQAED